MLDERSVDVWYCRVCGLNLRYIHWDENKKLPPTHEFCGCCNAQFGYNDSNANAAKIHRKKWIDGGVKWTKPKLKNRDWDLKEQLKNIPDEYKDDLVKLIIEAG